MLKKFSEYIEEKKLFRNNDLIIAAVSGGIDSVCMLDLLIRSGAKPVVAHCNFKLRNIESDEDEMFVRNLAKQKKVPFYSVTFETEEYAAEKGLSIQMAARELRYKWFEKLRSELQFKYIAVAHNSDDVIETFFINLTKGTGIKGLTGIQPKKEKIVRPLLFAGRTQIEEYVRENKIHYREDSSNSSDKYYRNFLRHRVIPLLKEYNPSFDNNILNTIHILDKTSGIYFESIAVIRKQITIQKNDQLVIDIEKLLKYKYPEGVLYEIIVPYGFNFPQTVDIISGLNKQPGKRYISPHHYLVKDRGTLIITVKNVTNEEFLINKGDLSIRYPVIMNFSFLKRAELTEIPNKKNIACIDADLIAFPLKIRKWRKGDKFVPLGMKNFKKLSDFFSDNKFSLVDKEEAWIITSQDNIVWIINNRLDNRYKVTGLTKNVFKISF